MKLSNLLPTLASNPPDLPSRSGYYLGYLMAKQLDGPRRPRGAGAHAAEAGRDRSAEVSRIARC
jgi:hypothetical protein